MVHEARLNEVLDTIEASEAAGKRRLGMSVWRVDTLASGEPLPECKTSACLAGWCTIVAGVDWNPYTSRVGPLADSSQPPIEAWARQWLGLSEGEASYIFYASAATLADLRDHIGRVLADPDIDHGDDES